jgi:pyruvate,orthophosphate dikinase
MTLALSHLQVLPRRRGGAAAHRVRGAPASAGPFASLDPDGVGELLKTAVAAARRVNPAIKLGICGEHGGDPASIELCERLGLEYVSCSPSRVPGARLAAAQAFVAVSAQPAT